MVMRYHSQEHMVKRLRVSIFVHQDQSTNKENLVCADSMIYLSIFFITGPTDNGNMGSCKWNKMQPTFLGVFLIEQQYPTVV
ncbi:hypothetical protein MTR_3g078400 [Medicago truncatula]|uniref:Uncharacterized protein n=1 Tax=Medicago truncatula TaxID=3880 RepID=A0A072V031_MEDTR|nr:hypothetical protein MTR_3g078400 [Medicago truncatula]